MDDDAVSSAVFPGERPVASALAISSEHRLRSENLPFDIDVWYPLLAQFTFRTVFLPLTRSEAAAVLRYQQTRYLNRQTGFGEAEVRQLEALELRLDAAIRRDFGASGAFFRLCGRSPKDAEPLDREGVWARYGRELATLQSQEVGCLDSGDGGGDCNLRLRAMARTQWLRVASGREAMSLLLTSERAYTDLHDWLEYGEPEQVVLREWQPDLSVEFEFRVFVCRDRLTAISQYDHYAVYPALAMMKDRLQALIEKAWAELHPHVGEPTYVVDFAYLPREDRAVLVELSPFRECTGAALFSWRIDRLVLQAGPLEFRLNDKLHPQIAELLESNWEQRWTTPSPPYWAWYEPFGKVARRPRRLRFLLLAAAIVLAAALAVRNFRPRPSLVALALAVLGAAALKAKGAQDAKGTPWPWLWQRLLQKVPVPAPRAQGRAPSLLFVYGTLRRGFHWHSKFLSHATFVTQATTVAKVPLVVGESGVPYLLGDLPGQGFNVRGELFLVSAEDMLGLDEYEGCGKGYYERRTMTVCGKEGCSYEANAYFKCDSSGCLRERPFIEEYTLALHRRLYRPIRHIAVKQEIYLQETGGLSPT